MSAIHHTTITFEMAHRCIGFGYGEDSIHGHTWTLTTHVRSSDPYDMHALQVEFDRAKEIVQTNVADIFDRSFMVAEQDDLYDFYQQLKANDHNIYMMNFVPTAQNIANYLFTELEGLFREAGLHLSGLILSEGDVGEVKVGE